LERVFENSLMAGAASFSLPEGLRMGPHCRDFCRLLEA
jgi:hypothetical protein